MARYAAAQLPELRLLEATIDRAALNRAVGVVGRLPFVTPTWDARTLRHAYTDPRDIAYRVDVRRHARAKRAAMREHRTQAVGGDGDRLLAVLSRLPLPLYRLALGREWFVDPFERGGRFLHAEPAVVRSFGRSRITQPGEPEDGEREDHQQHRQH